MTRLFYDLLSKTGNTMHEPNTTHVFIHGIQLNKLEYLYSSRVYGWVILDKNLNECIVGYKQPFDVVSARKRYLLLRTHSFT